MLTKHGTGAIPRDIQSIDPSHTLAHALDTLRSINPRNRRLSASAIVALNNAELALERVIQLLRHTPA